MKTILVTTRKGGVTKSVVALHLAWYLSERGRTLLIDLDYQKANSSSTLDAHRVKSLTASQLFFELKNVQIEHEVTPAVDTNLFLIPADSAISGYIKVEDKLPANADEKEKALLIDRRARQSLKLGWFSKNYDLIAKHFDYCVFDAPSSNHLGIFGAMIKGDAVVTPVVLEQKPLEGVAETIRDFQSMKRTFNPKLQFAGILPSKLDGHSADQRANLVQVVTAYPDLVLPDAIKKSDVIAIAERSKVPVWRLKGSTARLHGDSMRAALEGVIKRSFP